MHSSSYKEWRLASCLARSRLSLPCGWCLCRKGRGAALLCVLCLFAEQGKGSVATLTAAGRYLLRPDTVTLSAIAALSARSLCLLLWPEK